MTIENDRLVCDNCGRETFASNDEGWGLFTVKPKGIKVDLNMCPVCVQAMLPKPPEVKPIPKLEDCMNSLHVAGFLLLEARMVDEIHLPTRRSAIVTTRKAGDRFRVLEIYEDTPLGNWQLSNVITHLSNNYSGTWDESYEKTVQGEYSSEDFSGRVRWCCEQLLDDTHTN